MAQQSFVATLLEQKRILFSSRWMCYFFTEDQSPKSRSIIDFQQRAVWIALALIFQSTNEIINRNLYAFLGIFKAIFPFTLFIASFWALWMAMRPSSFADRLPAPRPWQRTVLIITLLLTILGIFDCCFTIGGSFVTPRFSNDGTSLDTNAAILLTQGRNPYTDSNMPNLLRRFYIIPNWTTPLRQGQFANTLDYPSTFQLQSILNTSLKADNVPEFEAKVSYPALSFLSLVPFVLLGNDNVLPFYLGCYLLLVFLAWKVAHPQIRPWILLLALANIPMWSSVAGGNLDIFNILLLIFAWWMRDHRWSSAICFGLALACKQISWYFAPFYFILIWRNYGFKEAIWRMAIAGSLGLLINLPFILWNAKAWMAGVMAPVADPMFPMGVGLIGLSTSHLLPYLPQSVYSLLEGVAIVFSIICYWRAARKCPESAMLLAVLPLFFAWRSLPSYFYCAAFPILILMKTKMKPFSLRALLPSSEVWASLGRPQTIASSG